MGVKEEEVYRTKDSPALGDRHVLWLIDLRDEQNCKILCGQRKRPKGQGPFQFFAVSIQCYSELLLLPK